MKLIDRIHLKWLRRVLRQAKFNKTEAAKTLGISIRTLRNWEIRFGMRHKLPSNRFRK